MPQLGFYEFDRAYREKARRLCTLIAQKSAIEEEEKALREELAHAMAAYGLDNYDDIGFHIHYNPTNFFVSIDSTQLKKKYPDIFAECSKVSKRNEGITVKLKPLKK